MARIPESEIERLKNEISVERLVEGAGIALAKSGKDRLGRCPFHEDDSPSLTITPAKNLWHCFGCGAGGGTIDWVMRLQGVSFRHAVEILREGAAVSPVSVASSLAAGVAVASSASSSAPSSVSSSAPPARPVKQSTVPKLAAPVAFDADDQALLNQVTDYYAETLKQSPEALGYLQTRGIDDPKVLGHFKLGYANRTLGLRLPVKNRVAGEQIRTRLQSIGIYRDSGHEHFNGSLIVPVIDASGNVTELYGRKILDNLRAGTPKHLYLPGQGRSTERGVWNVAALAGSREIILCEALIDALTFWCAGYRNVTASYGIEGFTEDMLAAFKRHGTERVLIAYDRDEAGERAAEKLAERLMGEGIECFRVQFPKGMDANEYALKVKPAAKSLGLVIRKAMWLGKGALAASAAPDGAAIPQVSTQVCVSAPAPVYAAEALKPLVGAPDRPMAVPMAAPMVSQMVAPMADPLVSAAPLPASPAPQTLRSEVACEVTDSEITFTLGADDASGDALRVDPSSTFARRYRVRGLAKNLACEVLKVNLLVEHGEAFHVDTFDLRAAKPKAAWVAQAATELRIAPEIINADVRRVFRKLEELQEAVIDAALTPPAAAHAQMTDEERAAALAFLRAPDLTARLLADFAACGLVGEETNQLVGYLAAVSRKLDRPLGIVIQSSSAAGKTTLMDAVLAFVPEEEKIKYSAMTGQSLFYMGETNLKHKALAIVEEEGASQAGYALKLLQSEGELTIASTGKDPATGNLITQQYRVEGPVALLITTTARDLDEELLNRCLVLAVDESRAQTQAIHARQRGSRTLEGLAAKQEKARLLTLHQNAQRLLRPVEVLNPYARHLTFPDQTTRLRRDHEKYLTLIDTIAYLHQHQRPVRTHTHTHASTNTNANTHANANTHTSDGSGQAIDYIEVTLADIALANRIAHEVLGRSLDELPPQTRRLLQLIDGHVSAACQRLSIARADYRFSRRSLREAINLGDTQLRLHLERLVEMEYILARRGAHGRLEYELLYETGGAQQRADAGVKVDAVVKMDGVNALDAVSGADDDAMSSGAMRLPGLIDVAALRALAMPADRPAAVMSMTASLPGADGQGAGSLRPACGVVAGRSRGEAVDGEALPPTVCAALPSVNVKPHVIEPNGARRSYPQPPQLPHSPQAQAFPLAAAAVA